MKPFGLSCLALLLLGLAGCETAGPASPATPAKPGPAAALMPAAPAKAPAGALDHLPAQRVRVDPMYPFEARQAGITGYVVVEFTINRNGDVVKAVAVEATYPAFIAPALACVSRWKYEPPLMNGQPVNYRTREKITFGQ